MGHRAKSKKLIGTIIVPGVPEGLEYDPVINRLYLNAQNQRVYSACRGFISVTGVTNAGLQAIGQVASPAHAHSLAVDAKSHDVWVTYADDKHSYFQRFK